MRIRTVKPEFWTHPVMARLEPEVQLLALALLNYADDHGYFRAEAELVRAACAPFTEDSVRIHGALTTLLKVGWIEVRDSGQTGLIGRIAKWTKHQRVNRPSDSKLKGYWLTEDSVNVHGGLTEPSLLEQGTGKGKESPIVPLSGDGGEGRRHEAEGERHEELVLVPEDPPAERPEPIAPELQRARAMFRMRESTPLDMAQIRAWRRAHAVVKATTPEEWAVLEGYYSAEIERREDFRRKDVVTCLNNWSGEITRAQTWAERVHFVLPEISEKKEKGGAGPDGWREVLQALYPDADTAVYADWRAVPESLKEEIAAVFREAESRGDEGRVTSDESEGRAA